MNRPAIPADLKRKVLVETGHRCAIPHCSSTEIDVHHIIPWETCQEHSPENLIVLCPNCHRRAGKGEIDRKSLIMYKLRGRRILQGEHKEVLSALDPWSTRVFREHRNDNLRYEAEAEYPYFSPKDYSWAEEVNAYIQFAVMSATQGVRDPADESPWTWAQDTGESSFGASYEVIFFQARLLSIRFSFFVYYFGANHPNHWTRSINVFLDPVYDLQLRHFFGFKVSRADYLGQVSKAVRAKFASRRSDNEGDLDQERVNEGTEPKAENFAIFNFSTSGFLFSFDEYSVGPYAAGRQEILIPFSELSGLVLPNELASSS